MADTMTLAGRDRAGDAARRVNLVTALMLAPSLLLLVLFLGLPLIVVLISSFQPNVLLQFEGPALDNYVYLSTNAYYADVVLRTVRLAFLTTIVALPLGYAMAYMMRDLSGRMGNLAIMALTFPILAGPLVIIIGWMALLADGGPIFGPLINAGLIGRLRLIGTETAVVVTLVQFVLPFVVLTLYTALRQIPSQVMEAASSLGASSSQRFMSVTLPLSLQGVLSATIIAFSLAASSYVSPYYIGGAAQLTLTTLIAQFTMATYNSQLAAASAILLLVVMIVLLVALTAVFKRLIRS
jgi:ABC-type spermidine/putrescine transport system permease subunit I